MKILLVGDTHGNTMFLQAVVNLSKKIEADIVFQLGDFGYGWSNRQGKGGLAYCEWTHAVSRLRGDIPWYWIPGNHENYDAIEVHCATTQPESDGTYELQSGVFYVPRPTMLNFGDLRFLCCGGAVSVDRQDRTPGKSWWSQESLTERDLISAEALGTADVLLAHDFPWEVGVVDRHLSPVWGDVAQRDTEANRRRVSQILEHSQATECFHGHLHLKYSEVIETEESGRRVIVRGLDCDNEPANSWFLYDTETRHDNALRAA